MSSFSGAEPLRCPAAFVAFEKRNKKTVLNSGYWRLIYKIKETLQHFSAKTEKKTVN
jgi:hypothetical protein